MKVPFVSCVVKTLLLCKGIDREFAAHDLCIVKYISDVANEKITFFGNIDLLLFISLSLQTINEMEMQKGNLDLEKSERNAHSSWHQKASCEWFPAGL